MLEDEPPQQEVLGVMLASLGFEVLRAADVEEALTLVDEEIDAAILDVVVPDPALEGRNGISVLVSLRKRYPNLPIVVFTGSLLSEEEVDLVCSLKACLLSKPLPYQQLVDFLQESRPH